MTCAKRALRLRRQRLFREAHLRLLRPVKVSRDRREERFVFAHLAELKSTPFELCLDEVRFATRLVGGAANHGLRMHNLWLYRTDQRRGAGDFIIVDVSRPPRRISGVLVPEWEVFVVDLKMHSSLRVGGRGGGFQLHQWERAARAAVRKTAGLCRLVPRSGPALSFWERRTSPACVWRLVGDKEAVLSFFVNLRQMRLHRRRQSSEPLSLERRFEAIARAQSPVVKDHRR